MPNLNKAAVIGGGIAGCSAAYALRQRGLSVTLYEKGDRLAGETSGNPLAVVEPRLVRKQDPGSDFFLSAWLFATKLYDDLEKTAGNIWHPCRGAVYMPGNDREKARMQDLAKIYQQHDGLLKFNPDLGLEFPGAGCVFPETLCRALTKGVEVKLGTPAGLPEGYDATILATGLNAFDPFGESPMRPNRGQINYLPALEDTPLNHVISFDGGYLTPAVDVAGGGRVHILGASFENLNDAKDDSWQKLVPNDLDQNLEALSKVRPDLATAWANAPLKGRVGLRATTLDHMPLVGPAFDAEKVKDAFYERQKLHHSQRTVGAEADIPGLYVLSGFASRGFTAAPLAAEVLAALITGEPGPCPAPVVATLDPKRFVIRDLKRN